MALYCGPEFRELCHTRYGALQRHFGAIDIGLTPCDRNETLYIFLPRPLRHPPLQDAINRSWEREVRGYNVYIRWHAQLMLFCDWEAGRSPCSSRLLLRNTILGVLEGTSGFSLVRHVCAVVSIGNKSNACPTLTCQASIFALCFIPATLRR